MKSKKPLGCPEIRKFKIGEIHPADYNPRIIKDENLAGLAESIRQYGCVEPIIVNIRNKKNIIIGGHQRYKVLQASGIKELICVTVNLDAANEKALNLTLNNPHLQGEFIEQLDEYIRQLQGQVSDELLLNLKINALAAEIAKENEKIGLVPDDQIPAKPKKIITKPGDLWLLGKNRLLCGDSTKAEDVGRLMENQKASIFATDPPYCVNYTGKDRPNGGKDWSGIGSKFIDVEKTDIKILLRKVYRAGFNYIQNKSALYLWHADSQREEIKAICHELGILIHQSIIWVKPFVVMGFSYYGYRHEPCFLMWRKGQMPKFDPKSKAIGTIWPVNFIRSGDPNTAEYYTDVWELDYDGKGRPVGIEHPTVKPVEVFAIPMRVHTRPGDICYEPFSGSGTQIIAAEKLGRKCYAMEIEPFFCDVAVKRWEAWTGEKAKLIRMKSKNRLLTKKHKNTNRGGRSD